MPMYDRIIQTLHCWTEKKKISSYIGFWSKMENCFLNFSILLVKQWVTSLDETSLQQTSEVLWGQSTLTSTSHGGLGVRNTQLLVLRQYLTCAKSEIYRGNITLKSNNIRHLCTHVGKQVFACHTDNQQFFIAALLIHSMLCCRHSFRYNSESPVKFLIVFLSSHY